MAELDLAPILLNAAGVGAGLLGIAAVALLSRPARLPGYSLALMALLAILVLDVASSIFDLGPWARALPQWGGTSYLLWPWIPVLLWAYVAELTATERQSLRKFGAHIAAACLGMALYLPTVLLPASDKLALADGTLRLVAPRHAIMALGLLGFILLWIGHILVAFRLIMRRLVAHRARMRDLLSDVEAVDLRWLNGFGMFISLGIAVVVADNLGAIFMGREVLSASAGALYEALIIAGLALFGLTQQAAVPAWATDIEKQAEQPPSEEPFPEATRYAKSSLSKADCEAILARLDKAMTSGEPWRDPFLNLKILAERITIKPYYVTQALNTVLQRNFYDYVNGWRARAAAQALIASNASVLSICEDVGFNSKSTFNAAFRKEMGTTPSAYRKAQQGATLE
ncbi:helix-turn-helix domain-containing protein [Novosphingobium cyanobacteriorum]|uniref:Helix-turn-helix transcriptional regulator n=1 Tax=Novosphingobium cyanobacteriorum TaxID=3024215 RepID=A0ABT6CRI1_9SPHN|nr:helix-turn-helix transcriptional regulator [Novosphingobium cyanobacteriorum]MDF8335177.1 helix-turn-helix transcriptional regulator [Novosphingobium cyanobacteriorum]